MNNDQVAAELKTLYDSAKTKAETARQAALTAKKRLGAFNAYCAGADRLTTDAKAADEAGFVGAESFWSDWTREPAPAPKPAP